MNNYAIILGNLGNTCDRFLPTGYKDQPAKEEMFAQAASIEDVGGIELVGSWDITADNVPEIKGLLDRYGIACAFIIPDHFSKKKWGKGAFTSRDPAIRADAISVTKEMMAIAARGWRDMIKRFGDGSLNNPISHSMRFNSSVWMSSTFASASMLCGSVSINLG